MYLAVIFRVIFWLGIAITIYSLFVPLELFLYVLGLGIVCLVYSLVEQRLLRQPLQKTQPTLQQQQYYQPIAQPLPFPQPSISLQQPPQQPLIAKSLRLPPPLLLPQVQKTKTSFWKQFFMPLRALLHRKPRQKTQRQEQQKIQHHFVYHSPQFERIKSLFQYHISQKKPVPPTFTQRQQTSPPQQERFQEQLPSARRPEYLFDWEHEEQYIPTGAELVQPESDDNYQVPAASEPITLRPEEVPRETKRFVAPPVKIAINKVPSTPATPFQPTNSQQKVSHEQQLAQLRAYVQTTAKAQYPLHLIKAEVMKAGWPRNLVEEVFAYHAPDQKRKKLIVLGIMVLALVILLVVLNMMNLLLFDYIIELFTTASLQIYIGASVLLLIILLTILVKTKKMMHLHKIRLQQEQTQHVEAIKEELQTEKKSFETDFDRLYDLLKEKKKLTVSEVAAGFGISRTKAEEWGKILKEQGIITLNYPAVGEAELLWKK